MKQFLKDNWFKLAILLIIIISIFAYFGNRNSELANKESKEYIQAYKLSVCLETASNNHDALVKVNTDKNGHFNSLDAAKFVSDTYNSEKADCFKQYPQ